MSQKKHSCELYGEVDCPTPEKATFESKHAARLWKKEHKAVFRGKQMRIYHCLCGNYHFTSQTIEEHERIKVKYKQKGKYLLTMKQQFKKYLK